MITVTVTSQLGYRSDPMTGKKTWHNGTDYAMPSGTPVMSVGAGKIVGVYLDDPLTGTAVVVDHRPTLPLMSSYLHLSGLRLPDGRILNGATSAQDQARLAESLKGRSVARGEMLGLSGGAKGQWGAGKSTGPHLHLRLKEWTGIDWVDVESLGRIDWTGVNLQVRNHGPRRVSP